MRRSRALVLAAGSLAVGVPAALAAGGEDADSAAPAAAQAVQDQPREDCPERDGSGSGSADDAPAAL